MALTKASKFGLKEVANVNFYDVTDTSGASTLFKFDTLKVSSIEVASEETSARGGQGNSELISWSYGKEITLTIEDALLSMDTIGLLFGGSAADSTEGSTEITTLTINADTFPGTYRIVGDTYLRSYDDAHDYAFTFTIPKGKVQANATLSMEAEGDPTTFE